MDFEPNYGSSEYSAEAEELFAQFLLMLEQGTAPEFEDFAAEHDSQSDELYGLHADWDNVRGLLAQLEGKRSAQAPALPEPNEEPKAEPEPTPEPETTPTDDSAPVEERTGAPMGGTPGHEESSSSGGLWKFAAVAGILGAVGLGVWGVSQSQHSSVLAQEKEQLREVGLQKQQELEAAERKKQELAAAQLTLQQELDTTRNTTEELKEEREDLSRNLEIERVAKSGLEEDKASLALELSKERQLKLEADLEIEFLAALVQVRDLLERELDLWPSAASQLTPMQNWLEEARALSKEISELRGQIDETSNPSDLPERLVTRLHQTEQRLASLESWSEDSREAWEEARSTIADPTRSPAYGGLDLAPQFPLVPIGPDPKSGLWTFADVSTGSVSPKGESPAEGGGALVLLLVPGLELAGARLEAFFVASTDFSLDQRRHAMGPRALVGEVQSDQEARLHYEFDLTRLGYSLPNSAQSDLARQAGVAIESGARHPIRVLRTESGE